MKQKTWLVYVSWILTLFICIVIWYFSSQDGSASTEQSDFLLEGLYRLFPGLDRSFAHALSVIIRKNGHLLEYTLLGLSTGFSLYVSFGQMHAQRLFYTGLLLCWLYAASDEIHQLFVPGRSGQFTDTLIDLSGAAIGLVLIFLIRRSIQKRRRASLIVSNSNRSN